MIGQQIRCDNFKYFRQITIKTMQSTVFVGLMWTEFREIIILSRHTHVLALENIFSRLVQNDANSPIWKSVQGNERMDIPDLTIEKFHIMEDIGPSYKFDLKQAYVGMIIWARKVCFNDYWGRSDTVSRILVMLQYFWVFQIWYLSDNDPSKRTFFHSKVCKSLDSSQDCWDSEELNRLTVFVA